MINYTERIALLMHDLVVRTPRLSFINLREVVLFGRSGRSVIRLSACRRMVRGCGGCGNERGPGRVLSPGPSLYVGAT